MLRARAPNYIHQPTNQININQTHTHTMTHHPQPNQNVNILNQPIEIKQSLQHHPFIRDYYTPRTRSGISFAAQGRTKQEFAAECDINNIMSRYLKTGIIDHVRDSAPQFLEASPLEFQEAMQIVAQAETLFEELPSSIRSRFENDATKLLEFVHNPENIAESVAMGFLDPTRLPPSANGSPAPPSAPQPAAGAVSAPSAPPANAGTGGKGA
ncbi:MAG: internal scaffolding protein [Microviridae sp.]|nr:MAG: internal scaffolding protein [Microviridae sp.]